jgi:hypothetical protein
MDFQYCETITRDKFVGKMCDCSLQQVAVFNTVKEKNKTVNIPSENKCIRAENIHLLQDSIITLLSQNP